MRAPSFGARRAACVSLMAVFLSVFSTGCATRVERLPVDEVQDLSGAWNDTDSRLVSDEMIKDVLSAPWLSAYQGAHKAPPALIVGEVRNLSHEHINTQTFISDMGRVLINSGKVQFVASRGQREEIREERKDQDLNAREDTRKPMGMEQGADFMLKGAINTIVDASGKTQVRYYQVDLSLISMSDNRIVWVGQKKIKKLVERSKLRF
ncbi:MAG: penicillin-binding protein activator LpoB [Pseudomonadota bacterium]